MKKVIKVIPVVAIIFIILLSPFVIRYYKQKQIKDNVIITENLFEDVKYPEEIREDDLIGTLTIPSIYLEKAPIKEGIELNILDEAIGHFPTTSILSGNIGFASHNGGDKAPYFKDLNKLKKGDEIFYESIYGTQKYIVSKIIIIDETDFSYIDEAGVNRLTLITCVRNQPTKRLCLLADVDK